ncbi:MULTISPECIES: transposase [unclassified Microcoleus]|uniref:transposase n=1 Tax=unclassified Microcoleus TaxID=2642155 RepID=UPI002FD4E038
MKYDRNKHHRHSIRLPGYDYRTPGAYFITICSWQRECLFGEVIANTMQLSPYGKTVLFNWSILPKRYQNVALDNFIVMPNHVHGIIVLKDSPEINYTESDKLALRKSKIHPLSEIVRGMKTSSARRINQMRYLTGVSVWQRGYYEHIIRNEESLVAIREYIINNPLSWAKDELYPHNSVKINESSTLSIECNGKSYLQSLVL